jgi:serine/threonine-protein kinase HipA
VGRPSRSRALGVWANGQRVGRWVIPASGPMELTYDAAWVASDEARPLSLSLPINLDGRPLTGDKVGFFFDNLLPDRDAIRTRVRRRFGTTSNDPFDLLEAIGRDCVGALQLLPDGTTPENAFEIAATPLKEAEIEELLLGNVSDSVRFGQDEDDFRISIAGAQEKTAFLRHRGRWCKPRKDTPTSHIFKLPLGLVGGRRMDMRESLENEWLCSRLLAAYRVPAAECEVMKFGSTKALVVTRSDRKLHSSGRYWLRLPQEDFCQATGTPSAMKYEADGGPGILDIARLLQGSDARDEDLATLMRAELLFWMLAAIDGHAKNFSIRLLPQGRFSLTPVYDVMSAWPITGSRQNQIHSTKLKLAMSLRDKLKHYRVAEIRRRHFNATARACGLGRDMESIIDEVVATTPHVIDAVATTLPGAFPAELFECVTSRLRNAAEQIAKMPAT